VSLLATTAARASRTEVEWQETWPRFRPSEAVVTAGLAGAVVGLGFFVSSPEQPKIEETNAIDEMFRGALRLHSRSARHSAAEVSDDIYYGLALYPVAVDIPLALALHRSPDVALELALMDAESYTLTGMFALAGERLGRARPMARECARHPDYDFKCTNPARLNQSFLSGHSAMSFTAAGLLCIHHEQLPLYGGGAGDTIACATGLTAAATAGALRVMSDNHYASDVFLGGVLGFASGYLLPALLHYRSGAKGEALRALEPRFHAAPFGVALSGAVMPVVAPEYAGVAVVGIAE
jgi:membrane-associated phospholipid phosphatase